jgi:hypothetical protein
MPIVVAWSTYIRCYLEANLLRERRRHGLLITLKHGEILILRITAGTRRRTFLSVPDAGGRLTGGDVEQATCIFYSSRSSCIVPLALGGGKGYIHGFVCQLSLVVATRQLRGFSPQIFEVIPYPALAAALTVPRHASCSYRRCGFGMLASVTPRRVVPAAGRQAGKEAV